MAFISSRWQITLGGATLLEVGDILDDEAKISRSDVVDVASVLETDNPAIFARKNAQFQLNFSRIKIFESDQEARSFLFTYPATFPISGTSDCVITDGSVAFTLAAATFQQNGYTSTTESEWFVSNHQIIGGPLSSSDVTPALDDFILAETGDFILAETGDQIILE